MYEGRWGERDDDFDDAYSDSDSDFGTWDGHTREAREWRPEWREDAWRVGWPRDREDVAAALWVMWFFEGGAASLPSCVYIHCHRRSFILPFLPPSPLLYLYLRLCFIVIADANLTPLPRRHPPRRVRSGSAPPHGPPAAVRRRAVPLRLVPLPAAPLRRAHPRIRSPLLVSHICLRRLRRGRGARGGGWDNGADVPWGVSDIRAGAAEATRLGTDDKTRRSEWRLCVLAIFTPLDTCLAPKRKNISIVLVLAIVRPAQDIAKTQPTTTPPIKHLKLKTAHRPARAAALLRAHAGGRAHGRAAAPRAGSGCGGGGVEGAGGNRPPAHRPHAGGHT
ncbi:hypothetical protein C8R44DRAFT_818161 [Mycena epipterygia]|nr:hypothetical protein C8R44DRAFT_818161 [Mycena epipterygia]